MKQIEDIHFNEYDINSSSEVKSVIFMSGEATHEIYTFIFTHPLIGLCEMVLFYRKLTCVILSVFQSYLNPAPCSSISMFGESLSLSSSFLLSIYINSIPFIMGIFLLGVHFHSILIFIHLEPTFIFRCSNMLSKRHTGI